MTEDKEFPYFDDEEREIIEAYKRGEYVLAENQEEHIAMLREAARNFMQAKRNKTP